MTGDVAQAGHQVMPRTYVLPADGNTVGVRPAGELPGVAEPGLSPVIATHGGAAAVAARIRVSPARLRDPLPRRLC